MDPGTHPAGSTRTSSTQPDSTPITAARNKAIAETESATEPVAGPADESSDDLKQIAGVGTGLARALRAMGIDIFEQVQTMDDAALTRLDDLVVGVRDRPQRHDWRGAAEDLLAQQEPGAF